MAVIDREDDLCRRVRQLETELKKAQGDMLDRFAVAALQSCPDWGNAGYGFSDAASDCYDMAEAMLRESKKRKR